MKPADATHDSRTHPGHQNRPARRAKPKRFAAALLAGLALLLSACSTPGPAHAYVFSPARSSAIGDLSPLDGSERAVVPAHVTAGERVLGLAYDPFTDHLFLRLHPGNRVRVVDRPAAAVKRAFPVPALPPGGHDLAVRSPDRHLFFTDPTGPALLETNSRGKFVRRLLLEGLDAPPWGVAHDPLRRELLVLASESSDRVHRFDHEGRGRGVLPLSASVRGHSLGFDASAREYFASLADGSAIGVFDAEGRLVRRLPRPAAAYDTFIDIGPRSFLRLF